MSIFLWQFYSNFPYFCSHDLYPHCFALWIRAIFCFHILFSFLTVYVFGNAHSRASPSSPYTSTPASLCFFYITRTPCPTNTISPRLIAFFLHLDCRQNPRGPHFSIYLLTPILSSFLFDTLTPVFHVSFTIFIRLTAFHFPLIFPFYHHVTLWFCAAPPTYHTPSTLTNPGAKVLIFHFSPSHFKPSPLSNISESSNPLALLSLLGSFLI